MSTLSPEVDRILDDIARLPVAQRWQIAAALRARFGDQPEVVVSDWLLAGLEFELRRKGLLAIPLTPARIKGWAKDFHADAAKVRDYLAGFFEPDTPRVQLEALGRLAARCYLGCLQDRYNSHPENFNLKSVLRNIAELPWAVEQSFPGYLASGLLMTLAVGT